MKKFNYLNEAQSLLNLIYKEILSNCWMAWNLEKMWNPEEKYQNILPPNQILDNTKKKNWSDLMTELKICVLFVDFKSIYRAYEMQLTLLQKIFHKFSGIESVCTVLQCSTFSIHHFFFCYVQFSVCLVLLSKILQLKAITNLYNWFQYKRVCGCLIEMVNLSIFILNWLYQSIAFIPVAPIFQFPANWRQLVRFLKLLEIDANLPNLYLFWNGWQVYPWNPLTAISAYIYISA